MNEPLSEERLAELREHRDDILSWAADNRLATGGE